MAIPDTAEEDKLVREEEELSECLDQCELEEGWTTVPKKKGEKESEMEDMMLNDDLLIPAGSDLSDFIFALWFYFIFLQFNLYIDLSSWILHV